MASTTLQQPAQSTRLQLIEHNRNQDQAFWMDQLFEHFDFTTSNNEAYPGDAETSYSIRESTDPTYPRKVAAIEAIKQRKKAARQPQASKHDDDDDDDCEDEDDDDDCEDEDDEELELLTENLVPWTKLKVYHYRSEYGFLHAIQSGSQPRSSFPESVDAFELFQDLTFMVEQVAPAGMNDSKGDYHNDWESPWSMQPCLLGKMDRKVTPRGSDLLELCRITPHFWRRNVRMVGAPWPGLPTATREALQAQPYENDTDECEKLRAREGRNITEDDVEDGRVRANQDEFFPLTRPALKSLVQTNMADWRYVRLDGQDGPQFWIGKRPQSQRWMGFMGTFDLNM